MSMDEFIVVPATAAGDAGVAALKQLLADFAGQPSRIKSLVGTTDAPSRAVLTLSAAEAEQLTARFAGQLLIERNADLSPLSPSTKVPH